MLKLVTDLHELLPIVDLDAEPHSSLTLRPPPSSPLRSPQTVHRQLELEEEQKWAEK